MIISVQSSTDHYVLSTDSLERPGSVVHIVVKPDEKISVIIKRLNYLRNPEVNGSPVVDLDAISRPWVRNLGYDL